MNRLAIPGLCACILVAGCATEEFAPDTVPPPAASRSFAAPATVYESEARNSFAQGDVAQAQSSIEESLQINPFDPVALNNLAVTKTEQGQFHEALALLQRAARLAPDNAEIAANLARLRSWSQNYAFVGAPVPGSDGSAQGLQNLPPEPPMLWTP